MATTVQGFLLRKPSTSPVFMQFANDAQFMDNKIDSAELLDVM